MSYVFTLTQSRRSVNSYILKLEPSTSRYKFWLHHWTSFSDSPSKYYIQSLIYLSFIHIYSHIHVCTLSHFSHLWLFMTPWTVAWQVPLSMGILQARIYIHTHTYVYIYREGSVHAPRTTMLAPSMGNHIQEFKGFHDTSRKRERESVWVCECVCVCVCVCDTI